MITFSSKLPQIEGNISIHQLYKLYLWLYAAAAAAKSFQSCPTLCDPIDGSLPGSAIPGILQTRTLEWVAISFSNAWKWKGKMKSLSHYFLIKSVLHGFQALQAPRNSIVVFLFILSGESQKPGRLLYIDCCEKSVLYLLILIHMRIGLRAMSLFKQVEIIHK